MSRATYEFWGHAPRRRGVPGRVSFRRFTTLLHPDPRRAWRRAQVCRLVVADAVCALGAAAVGLAPPGAPQQQLVGLTVPLVWVVALLVVGGYDRDVHREGRAEPRRVLTAAGLVLAAVAIYSWSTQASVPRGFVALTLPLAAALTIAARQLLRRVVHSARTQGRYAESTLLVGDRSGVALLHERLRRRTGHGSRVIGCCLSSTDDVGRLLAGLPVLGGLTDVVDVVREHDVDAVAVLPSAQLDGAALRHLRWQLESTGADLLLAPSVPEAAGRRVRVRALGDQPVLHVLSPDLSGPRGVAKAVFDRVGAAVLLGLVAPVLGVVAAAIAVSSRGPVLVREGRLGRDAQPFAMLRFRTTGTVGHGTPAEATPSGRDGTGTASPVAPSATPLGRFLQRWSLDELPQLLNVLTGDMSLVGPRPPLPAEAMRYSIDARRRFAVKPGLTGTRQINSRSGPSREEAVRQDIEYVDNWTLGMDLAILSRTVVAVIRRVGGS